MKNKININGRDFTVEELNKLIENSTPTVEQQKEAKFLELFQGLELKSDIERYPDSVFYFRNGKYALEINKSYLWVSYYYIWGVFEDEFNMEHTDIQKFITTMVEKHFNWKGLTPSDFKSFFPLLVEKHFKN